MTKLIVAFRNFANAPKKQALYGDHVRLSVCDPVSANFHGIRYSSTLKKLLSKSEFRENRMSYSRDLLTGVTTLTMIG